MSDAPVSALRDAALQLGTRNRQGASGFGHQGTLGEAENLASLWPEFFTLPTFGRDGPRAGHRPKPPLALRSVNDRNADET